MTRLKGKYFLYAMPLVLLIVAFAVAAGVHANANKTEMLTLPAGTMMQVRLDHALASDQNRAGDAFTATLTEPLTVDGKTVVPTGAQVQGQVVDARQGGRLRGVSHLQLRLTSVDVEGQPYSIETGSFARVGENHKKRNWSWIGGGGGAGMLIGALAGGGKGALIGGPVGAGAGLAVAAYTGKKDIRLPAESRLNFRLTEPLTVERKL